MRVIIIAALFVAAVPGSVLAQDAAGTSAATTPPPIEKKTCRTYGTTGSILGGKRICHTKAEWAQLDGEAQRDVDNLRNRGGHAGS